MNLVGERSGLRISLIERLLWKSRRPKGPIIDSPIKSPLLEPIELEARAV